VSRAYGARCHAGATYFRVRSPRATALWLCLFDGATERRFAMQRDGCDWQIRLDGEHSGIAYGYRAEGEWAPTQGQWFDPSKLLVDPYAVELDRRFQWQDILRQYGVDTATVVPRALVPATMSVVAQQGPLFETGQLIYEVNVRGFSMLHPVVPQALRGTVAALAEPAVIAHLKKLRVRAVELMPITAALDERHLSGLGLRNAWGYNPVALMALDPQLCPGGVMELRSTIATLHAAGIAVILDLVFNHTGESDARGGVLSLRGLDNDAYAHSADGELINDTGCGNTLNFANPVVRELTIASLHHFVEQCGVDGFRFDLATALARGPGFSPAAPLFDELAADSLLADRVLIAEPWDVGPDGYQLGRFPSNWLEWNDRFRDDVRRFWRGDGTIGAFVQRLAGSSDVFGQCCRSVNFLAAHDGFTLADTVAFAVKRNEANGEANRDGQGENYSWNNGIEGKSADPLIGARRMADLRALLASLFASSGTIMLTAGDEFARSQDGNNNAYAQDNATSWLDWKNRSLELEDFVAELARLRAQRQQQNCAFPNGGIWRRADGELMSVADWENPQQDEVIYDVEVAGRHCRLEVSRAQRLLSWEKLA
jgi:glycogen debranching enzyme